MKKRQRMMEQRAFNLESVRIEQRAEGQPSRITGHAAVFNWRSDPLFEWGNERVVEVILPGAFVKTIQEADIRALINHDRNMVLGRNRAGTLKLVEDAQGLAVEIEPPDTGYARDLMISMERGDMDQMSFGFQAVKETWVKEVDAAAGTVTHVRTVSEARLWDVSIVTYPAYPNTDAQVRSLLDGLGDDAPAFLRELSEPAEDSHSGDRRLSTEPVQDDHSGDERKRQLDLIKATL